MVSSRAMMDTPRPTYVMTSRTNTSGDGGTGFGLTSYTGRKCCYNITQPNNFLPLHSYHEQGKAGQVVTAAKCLPLYIVIAESATHRRPVAKSFVQRGIPVDTSDVSVIVFFLQSSQVRDL